MSCDVRLHRWAVDEPMEDLERYSWDEVHRTFDMVCLHSLGETDFRILRHLQYQLLDYCGVLYVSEACLL